MAIYTMDIQYPIHIDGKEREVLEEQNRFDVWEKFETMKWRQCRTLQLQLSGKTTTFKIVDIEHGYTILFTVLDRTLSGEIELSIKTNIPIIVTKKDLFGLMTRKKKEELAIERATLNESKQYLEMILKNDFKDLEQAYFSNVDKSVLNSAMA